MALVAVLAIGGAGAASASAASWHVGGGVLSGSEALGTTFKPVTGISFEFATGAAVQCVGNIELKNAKITSPGTGQVEHMILNECTMQASPSCTVEHQRIETAPLTMEAALGSKSPEDTVIFKPTAGKTNSPWMEIQVPNEACFWYPRITITGQAKFIMPTGREEKAEQEIIFHAGTGELRNGSFEVKFTETSKSKFKLASGKAWSFR